MKVRRKPTITDAVQFTDAEDGEEAVFEVFGKQGFTLLGDATGWMLQFKTAHGDLAYARPGDWVFPDSEPLTFYPVKDDVFQKTYEIVEEL